MATMVKTLLEKLKTTHRAAVWTGLLGVFLISGITAFLLRFDFHLPHRYLRAFEYAIPIWLLVKAIVFRATKLDRGLWRYVSLSDIVRLLLVNLLASVLSFVALVVVTSSGLPRSVYILDLMICFLGTSGLMVTVRMFVEATAHGHHAEGGKRTLIYGAGDAGLMLLREIRANSKMLYRVIGFIDDDPAKKETQLLGLTVLGCGGDLQKLVAEYDIKMLLIAVPSAAGPEMIRILNLCQSAGVEYKTIPGLSQIIEGRELVGQIRDVAVEDLLGRTPVHVEDVAVWQKIQGKVVLVTGAAGSIGSELTRQIAHFAPAAIIGFEMAESPLFELDSDMRKTYPHVPFVPVMGSIQNRARLDEIILRYSPSIIYHAAAYKHVPMMETHVFEAIENNVFGTYNVAMAAIEHGVEDFILISSDKAVRPTNMMGATKRLTELILLSLSSRSTKFIAVRFGNVLGSNGSVIPTFKRQIAAGGPVTVTHPEMRRYFMTIPEAAQLVLQASAMGHSREIFVLDMGSPIKIVDLAYNLILLSGLKPDKDIKIEFTGIRPGEKLYEELNSADEDTIPTRCEKIKIFTRGSVPLGNIDSYLETLKQICSGRDLCELVLTLKDIIPEYNPSGPLLQRVVEIHRPHRELPQWSPAHAEISGFHGRNSSFPVG